MHPFGQSHLTSDVAVIGPEDSVAEILALRDGFPALRLVPYAYEHEQEATARFREIEPSTRVVLFTGPIPYFMAKALGEPSVPLLHVPFTGVALYRTLFQLFQKYDLTQISIDTINRKDVLETYADLGLFAGNLFTLDYSHALRGEDLVRFHRELYERGKTGASLTCLRSAHRALVDAGIPSLRVVPTRRDLLDVLERTYLVAENIRTGETQVVVGLIDVGDLVREARMQGLYTDLQQNRLKLQGKLVRFAQQMDGHLTAIGGDEYMIHTTKGPFMHASANLRSIPLLKHLLALGSGKVHMGVGMGFTAAQAGVHARLALDHSRRHGSNSCYVVTEDRRVVGPLGSAVNNQYEARVVDRRRMDLARAAGVSPAALNRLVSAIRTAGLRQFTAGDLAPWLHVTVRSARRLLRLLAEAGVVRAVGEESPAMRGRPRHMFELDWPS